MQTYIDIYIYVERECVRVCLCVRERERCTNSHPFPHSSFVTLTLALTRGSRDPHTICARHGAANLVGAAGQTCRAKETGVFVRSTNEHMHLIFSFAFLHLVIFSIVRFSHRD